MALSNILVYVDKQAAERPGRTAVYGVLTIAAASAIAVAFGNTADHIGFIRALDARVYAAIHLAPHAAWLDSLVRPFNFNLLPWGGTFIPSFVYLILALAFLYVLLTQREYLSWTIIAILAAVLIDTLLYKFTDSFVSRARPFLSMPNIVPASSQDIWRAWPTYPSGHVRDAAIYSTAASGYAPKLFWPLFIFTVWIGYTRLYLGAHYPTDVLAGMLLGYSAGLGILMIVKSLQRAVTRKSTGI